MGECREKRAILFSEMHSGRTRGNEQKKLQLYIKKKRKKIHNESGQTLEECLQGCGISIFGDLQNLTGRGP